MTILVQIVSSKHLPRLSYRLRYLSRLSGLDYQWINNDFTTMMLFSVGLSYIDERGGYCLFT